MVENPSIRWWHPFSELEYQMNTTYHYELKCMPQDLWMAIETYGNQSDGEVLNSKITRGKEI